MLSTLGLRFYSLNKALPTYICMLPQFLFPWASALSLCFFQEVSKNQRAAPGQSGCGKEREEVKAGACDL